MPEAIGIENTKKFIADLRVLIPIIVGRLKDGADVSDAVALVTNADVRAAIQDAFNSAKHLPEEEKDLSLDEAAQLIPDVVGLVTDIIKATKG